MMHDDENVPDPVRRRMLRTIAAAPLIIAFPSILTACREGDARDVADGSGNTGTVAPTLACADDDDDDPTAAQTEGPFFKTSSPKRTSLIEAGTTGTRLSLVGLVMTRSCKPVPNALIDFWQADDSGEYDNVTFRLRGHQFASATGTYRLDTIVPGLYPGRTRHIHVKVQAPNQRPLTTQLYFPDEAANTRDRIFAESLLVTMAGSSDPRQAKFNFVLDLP